MSSKSIAQVGNPLVDAIMESLGLEGQPVRRIHIDIDALQPISIRVQVEVWESGDEGIVAALRDLEFVAVG